MERRDFLRSTGLISTALLLPRFVKATGRVLPPGVRRLVVVQLSGGNDALNTIVPYADDAYHSARGLLAVRADKVLRITDAIGFNPALAPLLPLIDRGELAILNGVGYPNPDRSHFRSMDIWHTASASDEVLTTGWLGRYLDHECAHPHGVVEFGQRLSLANTGSTRKAIALTDPRRFHAATREPLFAHLAESAPSIDGNGLGFLYRTMAETYESAAHINAHLRAPDRSTVYPKGVFAASLRDIATFIGNGMETRVYYAGLGGFDTHVNQQGKHERVLGELAAGLSAFINDLRAQGALDDTLVMVFSEFGRRVKRNASNGTDHGSAGSMLLLGGGLRSAGPLNPIPSLAALDANGDLVHTTDFRSIYAAIMHHWLGARNEGIVQAPDGPMKGLFS